MPSIIVYAWHIKHLPVAVHMYSDAFVEELLARMLSSPALALKRYLFVKAGVATVFTDKQIEFNYLACYYRKLAY